MKVVSILRFLTILVGVAAISESPTRAQAEIDPDHFESPNVRAPEKAKKNAGDFGHERSRRRRRASREAGQSRMVQGKRARRKIGPKNQKGWRCWNSFVR